MAATTNLERGWARRSVVAMVAGGNRGDRLDRARRHTRRVRLLRWSLPLGAAGVLALYVAIVLQTIGWVNGLPQIDVSQIMPENLTMHNPRYEGFNDDGGSYVVTADTAVQDLSNLNQVKLNGIVGDLTDANKVKTNLKATHGLYDTKTNELELYDGIDVVSESGMHAKLTRATVVTKDNVVVSKEPVTVDLPTGSIRADEMIMHNKSREVTFHGSVTAHLVPDKQAASSTPAAPASTAGPLISAANGPIDVTAKRLDIDDAKKIATFSGNVRATQGDALLVTDALEVHYAGAGVTGADPAAGGAKISRIASRVPVVMTRAPQDRVTAKTLDFDAGKEVAVLAGDVVMTSGPERRVTSDEATVDQKADTVLLTGNVVATQGRNELKGGRLFVERASARTQLTSPADPASSGRGRISTRFFSGDAAGKPAKKGAAPAAGSATTAAVFKTDPNAPVDIEADRLDVDDKGRLAVFKGDVHAAQGDFVVRTAELRAHYTGEAGLAAATDAAAAKTPAQLTRIEARGKVIVTSKNGQDATGDWADFDVKANKVTLGGDVVLSQDQNVVHGTRLIIDMATGQSIIHNDPGGAWTAKAAPSGPTQGSGFVLQGPNVSARPSAVFYPRQKKTPENGGAPAKTDSPPTPSTDDGWSATGPTP